VSIRPLWAEEEATTIQSDNLERGRILTALRIIVRKGLKKPMRMKVDRLKVQSGWAFSYGVPHQTGGKLMNYKGTPRQEAVSLGGFDDWFCALLHEQHERWQVVTYSIGAPDVAYDG